MAEPEPNKLMICPYNKSHHVEHYRMHVHLQKCRMQYPNSNKTTCPFDATHVIPDVEMDYHVAMCPKRIMFDTSVYVLDDDYRPVVQVPPPPAAVSTDENWDDDNVTSYVPDLTKRTDTYRKIKGATPSERRKARMEGIRTYRPPEANSGTGSSTSGPPAM